MSNEPCTEVDLHAKISQFFQDLDVQWKEEVASTTPTSAAMLLQVILDNHLNEAGETNNEPLNVMEVYYLYQLKNWLEDQAQQSKETAHE